MKKFTLILLISFSFVTGFCELPILRTPFHSNKIDVVLSNARQDNPDAQIELALRYYAGHQVPQNLQEAFNWMAKAAGQGNSSAQALLSRMYDEGIGTKDDALKAETWFVKALVTDPENAELQQQYKSRLTAKSPEVARRFLQLCADAGYAPAFVESHLPMATGLYQQGDYKGAEKIFRQLAEKGNPSGMYYLGRMYASGQGGLPEDYAEAFDWYSSAALANQKDAQYALAVMYEAGKGTGKNPEEADHWYEKSAQNGCAAAQYQRAESAFAEASRWAEQVAIDEGNKSLQDADNSKYRQNLELAVAWYRKAASQNYAGAQYMLGRLSASGEGLSQDFRASVAYYEQASGQGFPDALFYLALMHHSGLGVEKDADKAVSLYEQAVEQGSRAAMFYLGNCYYYGNGVDQNARKGELFYRNTALGGVHSELVSKSGTSDPSKNVWVLRAAKEYGILLWRRASSDEESAESRKWMSLAARGGDPEARKILVQMTARNGSGKKSENITGHPADPRRDAVAQRRDPNFTDSYLLENIKEIYPDFKPARIITAVRAREDAQSLNGDKLWELSVKYQCMAARRAVGLKGILMMGVEFQDRVTGEKYWAFNESKDPEAAFTGGVFTDVSMFVDLSRHPNLRIRNWAIAYGHLFNDDQVLAVLDERSKTGNSGALDQMIYENRFSAEAASTVVATVDITGTEQSSTIAAENKAKSEETKQSDGFLSDILPESGGSF
jgi:hypothetical protein